MSVWLDAARLLAGLNVVLLVVLGAVWGRNYRRHGASHTLSLLVFAGFLLVENLLWVYFYAVHPAFIGWFRATSTEVQVGLTALCGLELLALVVVLRITWR